VIDYSLIADQALAAGFDCFLVALPPTRVLLLCAKHLFVAAMMANCPCREVKDEQWEFFSPDF
jgi:hypothetical protein